MWGRRVLPTVLPAPFSATLSPALLVYLCANVGLQGLLVVGLPAPFIPHSASLGPTTATRVLFALVPISAPPTGLDVWFFISTWCRTSLPFDFLSVLVVRGGAVCLPTPPSWFCPQDFYYKQIGHWNNYPMLQFLTFIIFLNIYSFLLLCLLFKLYSVIFWILFEVISSG